MNWWQRFRFGLARLILGQSGKVTARVDDSRGWSRYSSNGRHDNDLDAWELQEQYGDALTAWRKNPLARRIVSITSDYVLGDGIKFTSSNADVEAYIQAFWNHPQNHMDSRLEAMSDELARAGDLFPVLFRNDQDGMSYIRFVIKSRIQDIVTASNDWERELTYVEQAPQLRADPVRWRSPKHPMAALSPAIMLHYSVNRPLGALMGESDLGSMLPWLLRYSRMLEDRVRLHWAARAFLWFVTVPTNKVQSKSEAYQSPPEAGSVIVKDKGESWEMLTPNLRGLDAAPDLKALRMMIQAGSSYPPIWMGESGASTLAEARMMAAPAERHLRRRQLSFCDMLKDVLVVGYERKNIGATLDRALIVPQVADVSRADNNDLAEAGDKLSSAFNQMMLETEPRSRTLTELYLTAFFKFIGEPQSKTTIDTILSEIFTGVSASANATNGRASATAVTKNGGVNGHR